MQQEQELGRVLEAIHMAQKQAESTYSNLEQLLKMSRAVVAEHAPYAGVVESLADDHMKKLLKADFATFEDRDSYVEQAKKVVYNFVPIVHQGIADKMLDGLFGALPMGLNMQGDKMVLKQLATTVLQNIESLDTDNREAVALCNLKIRFFFLTLCQYLSKTVWKNKFPLYETFGAEHKEYTKMVYILCNSFMLNLGGAGYNMVIENPAFKVWEDFIEGMRFKEHILG